MYGVYDAYIVYGWEEGNRENAIDQHWLSDHDVEGFAVGVVKNHAGELVYGLECTLDKATGLVNITAKAKNRVQAAHRASGSRSTLGYHAAMSGDYDSNHCIYLPDKGNRVGGSGSDDGSSSPPAKKKRNNTDSP